MIPLFFIDSNKADKLRKKARLERLYLDVLNEAKTLVRAECTCLYLRVDKDEDIAATNGSTNHNRRRRGDISILPGYHPSVNGEYLYAMYYVVPSQNSSHNNARSSPTNALMRMVVGSRNSDSDSTSHITGRGNDAQSSDYSESAQVGPPPLPLVAAPKSVSRSRVIPVGKGIVSRAILTGTSWNIASGLVGEPDFYPLSIENADGCTNVDHGSFRDLVVVPILDGQGRVIAVLEALNKKRSIDNNNNCDEDENYDKVVIPTGAHADNAGGFTDQDVEVLVSLASHVSVSLQTIYQDSEEEDLRLRDTIRILKEGMVIRRSKTSGGSTSRNDSGDHDASNRSNAGDRQFRKRVKLFPD